MANRDQEVAAAPAGEQVATEETMTFVGMTLGELISQMKALVVEEKARADAKDETLGLRDREIQSLHGLVSAKNDKIAELTADLGAARLVAKEAKGGIPVGLERLPGGGIRLGVELDADEATPLLSWADSAGEDPATYVARQVHDALVAVTQS